MDARCGIVIATPPAHRRQRLLVWLLPATLCVAGVTHAATVYRCAGQSGSPTFQDHPCPTPAAQTKLAVAGQPLIDPNDHHAALAPATLAPRTTRGHQPQLRHRPRRRAESTSWECRAADGEVFYRHSRCPASVPGDGVVRDDFDSDAAPGHARGRHTAWSRVRVHGTKVTRSEACSHIDAVTASGRDGYQRDARVSTYDHLMGRDPCAGY